MENFNEKHIIKFCNKINMPEEVVNQIKNKINLIDEEKINGFYKDFFEYDKAEKAYKILKEYTNILDEDNICELIVLLAIAIECNKNYTEKGIDENIYLDTMKCFSRFIKETHKWTGKWNFDRGFWVWRQLSLILFRIGELEFEICDIDESLAKKINQDENGKIIYVHIPNDAKCEGQLLHKSYLEAKSFFKKYFNYNGKIVCSTWLLGKELEQLLNKDSGISNFRKDYNMLDCYFESNDYLQWVFDKYEGDIKDFMPKTSLQKSIKEHLLNGGKMTVGLGVLKEF